MFEEKNIGDRVNKILKEKQLTVASAVKLTGITQPTLSRTIGSHTMPKFDQIQKIYERIGGINAHYLLTGQGPVLSEGQPSFEVSNCQRELEAMKAKLASAEKMIKLQDDLVASLKAQIDQLSK